MSNHIYRLPAVKDRTYRGGVQGREVGRKRVFKSLRGARKATQATSLRGGGGVTLPQRERGNQQAKMWWRTGAYRVVCGCCIIVIKREIVLMQAIVIAIAIDSCHLLLPSCHFVSGTITHCHFVNCHLSSVIISCLLSLVGVVFMER